MRIPFASKAPEEIPDWYDYPGPVYPGGETEMEIFAEIEQIGIDAVRKRNGEIYAKWSMKKYFAWKLYYAKMMLEAMQEIEGE